MALWSTPDAVDFSVEWLWLGNREGGEKSEEIRKYADQNSIWVLMTSWRRRDKVFIGLVGKHLLIFLWFLSLSFSLSL